MYSQKGDAFRLVTELAKARPGWEPQLQLIVT